MVHLSVMCSTTNLDECYVRSYNATHILIEWPHGHWGLGWLPGANAPIPPCNLRPLAGGPSVLLARSWPGGSQAPLAGPVCDGEHQQPSGPPLVQEADGWGDPPPGGEDKQELGGYPSRNSLEVKHNNGAHISKPQQHPSKTTRHA